MRRRYHFIRHGQPVNDARSFTLSEFNRDMRGHKDEGLSETGRRQALAAAARVRELSCELVISSQMQRAIETADLISEHSGVPRGERRSELNELAPGSLSEPERTLARALASKSLPAPVRRPLGRVAAGALSLWQFGLWGAGLSRGHESISMARRRILDELDALDAREPSQIAVVGHGFWILVLALSVPGLDFPRWVANCSITTVESDGQGKHRLVAFARPTHWE